MLVVPIFIYLLLFIILILWIIAFVKSIKIRNGLTKFIINLVVMLLSSVILFNLTVVPNDDCSGYMCNLDNGLIFFGTICLMNLIWPSVLISQANAQKFYDSFRDNNYNSNNSDILDSP